MPGKMFENTATSLSDFRELLAKARTALAQKPNPCDPEEFWYRGHDRGTHALTPSLFRHLRPQDKEQRLFALHTKAMIGHSGTGPFSWDVVYRMQHYGIPTRLLDWTTKPYIAAFFALSASRTEPCIYVLNPRRLNRKNGIDRVVHEPADGKYGFEETFYRRERPLAHPLAVLPTSLAPNDRMRTQCGRFTVQAIEAEPLEIQSPESVARIWLGKAACEELLDLLEDSNITPLALFPDHEGIAQFVIAGADLDDEEAAASTIRQNLRRSAEHDLDILLRHRCDEQETLNIKGIGFCTLDSAYIERPDKTAKVSKWLDTGPPLLFITGEAGIGKTNFILHSILQTEAFRNRPPVFFSFKLYGSRQPDGFTLQTGEQELERHLYEAMIGTDATDLERQVARKMIREGNVVLALDGLDELARIRSQEAVEAVADDLDSLVGASTRARVIVSCRDHILERLRGTGVLGKTTSTQLRLGRFAESDVIAKLEPRFGKVPPELAAMAIHPLFYEMVRHAQPHWSRLVEACRSGISLETEWLKVMLEAHQESPEVLRRLGHVAGVMLQSRSDLLEIKELELEQQGLVRRLSERPFALFIEELKDTYTFSHQLLREFVLAWCVAEEVRQRRFDLLSASSCFDYEGAEFYARVSALTDLGMDVVKPLDTLLDPKGLDEVKWNNLARNLFEMIGELMPENPDIASVAVRSALEYLKPGAGHGHYVTYKTKYNIARCLERIHYTAPREPHFHHIVRYKWSSLLLSRDHYCPASGIQPVDNSLVC